MDVYVEMNMFVVLHDFDLMAACIASAYFLVKSAPYLFLPEKLKRAFFCTECNFSTSCPKKVQKRVCVVLNCRKSQKVQFLAQSVTF